MERRRLSAAAAHARVIVSGELLRRPAAAVVFTVNTVIRGYGRAGGGAAAVVRLHRYLLRRGLPFDSYTLPALISAATAALPAAGARAHGGAAHGQAERLGFSSAVHVANALIHFYSLAAEPGAARRAFELCAAADVVSYNTLLTALFRGGEAEAAQELFEEMPERNAVTWTAVVSGLAQAGRPAEALARFAEMQRAGAAPGGAALVGALSACAQLGALALGRWLHGYAAGGGAAVGVEVGTALIEMYGKCGDVAAAEKVFEGMRERNLAAWTSVVAAMAAHGRGAAAVARFREMEAAGVAADDVAFIGALAACAAAGMVEEGRRIFAKVAAPKVEHYGCLVDLLGRAGRAAEAAAVVGRMGAVRADARIWSSIVAASGRRGDVATAERAAARLIREGEDGGAAAVMLANVYAAAGRHVEAARGRRRRQGRTPGWSGVEVNGRLRQFIAGDRFDSVDGK
ncbi:pentatricopeptide repeat-containing protein At5g66520-like [Wolffia australiana]